MNEDLKKIKNFFGEKMSHLCRELFPTFLDKFPGVLPDLLSKHFEPTRWLYDDIVNNNIEEEFKNYIYSLVDVEQEIVISDKSPYELLKEAGYTLYECKTEEDIQSFKKYYRKDEELCTFGQNRLKKCFVFFAVKDNVDEIKREDFLKPERQDAYGTSVISIQFNKSASHSLSIKNRYNHKVNNPDATFSNNLDNIIPGLTSSFENFYGLRDKNVSSSFEIPNYVLASDGKYYKHNMEINNIYFCPSNMIIDNFKVKKFDSSKYLIMDQYILELESNEGKHTIRNYIEKEDAFTKSIGEIQNISIRKNGDTKIVDLKTSDGLVTIEIDSQNRIIGYANNNIEKLPVGFLKYNKTLQKLNIPNVRRIDLLALVFNEQLTDLELPNVEYICESVLCYNHNIESINAPKLKYLGFSSLQNINPNLKNALEKIIEENNKKKKR